MKIVCLGDSNTWGYDSRSIFGEQYPLDVRWTGILKNNGYDIVNLGANGMCIPTNAQLDWVKETIEKELPFDFLTVMLGSNDLLRNDKAVKISLHLRSLVDELKQIVSEKQILIIAPPVLQKGTWVESEAQIEESKALAELYYLTAKQTKTAFADASTWNIPVLYDGVHFTEEGHAIFADQLDAKLIELRRAML